MEIKLHLEKLDHGRVRSYTKTTTPQVLDYIKSLNLGFKFEDIEGELFMRWDYAHSFTDDHEEWKRGQAQEDLLIKMGLLTY